MLSRSSYGFHQALIICPIRLGQEFGALYVQKTKQILPGRSKIESYSPTWLFKGDTAISKFKFRYAWIKRFQWQEFLNFLALKQFQECDLLSLLQKNKTLISSTKHLICWDLNSPKLWDLNSHLLDTKIQKWGTADTTFQINNLNTPEARYHRQQTCDHYLLWNLWHWELEMWWPYHSWNCEMWSVAHD